MQPFGGRKCLSSGSTHDPSQHVQPPVLQYLEWTPSANGPPRPFSWSTSWRSFSISSDRRPCARQTQVGVAARCGREGRGGQRRHQSRGEAEECPAKSKARDPSRATDFTRRDEVQLKSDHKGSSGRAGGGRGEGCVWGRILPEQACRALPSTLHRAHEAEHHRAVLSRPC